ncbi:MAG: HU family DNA-binding protein [Candidatus Glassbacteria bacterium]
MNKAELVEALAKKTGMSQKDARRTVEALFSTDPGTGIIAAQLDRGNRVQLTGFGTFEIRNRKARTGRNPQTNETIHIPGRRYPTFKPGKALKERVKE